MKSQTPIFVQPAKQACSCAALGRIRVLAGGGTPGLKQRLDDGAGEA